MFRITYKDRADNQVKRATVATERTAVVWLARVDIIILVILRG